MLDRRLGSLLFSNYLNLFGFSLFTPLYALFATQVGAGPELVGISWSFYTFVTAVMVLLFGRLETRIKDPGKAVVAGYFLLAIGAAAFLLVDNIVELFVVQAFNAIGAGMLLPAWKATYADDQHRGKETQQWALYDGGNMLFTAAGAAAGGIVLATAGFRGIFMVMAVLQFVAAIYSLRLVRGGKGRARKRARPALRTKRA
ncbi:MAG: MFS transporter [Patescibacteria group bacterium]